jgi:hypothetical protein
MVDHMYLSTQSKILSIKYKPVSLSIISRYLKDSIIPDKKNLEVEINRFSNHQYESFNTFGAARLEILFYEKTSSEPGREQITLYGIAENSHFQLKSFTLFCDTCWLDKSIHHPEDRYFDSIIIDLSGSSPVIHGSSLELSLRNADGVLSAHSSSVLRFNSILQKEESSTLFSCPQLSEIIDRRTPHELEPEVGGAPAQLFNLSRGSNIFSEIKIVHAIAGS